MSVVCVGRDPTLRFAFAKVFSPMQKTEGNRHDYCRTIAAQVRKG